MKKFNNLMTYESFIVINEGIKTPQLTPEMKKEIDAFIQKNRSWLQKALAKFQGKSPQEIANMIATPNAVPVKEGVISNKLKEIGNKVKGSIGNWLSAMSTGTAIAGFGSALVGLFQLASTSSVTQFLTGGAIALLVSIVIYAVSQVFGTTQP